MIQFMTRYLLTADEDPVLATKWLLWVGTPWEHEITCLVWQTEQALAKYEALGLKGTLMEMAKAERGDTWNGVRVP